MNNINNQIYLIAATELLINNNSSTDLGNYVLEYGQDFAEINFKDMSHGDGCLAIKARLVNKQTGKIEWGNVYYKRLIKSKDFSGPIYKEDLMDKLKAIYALPIEEKIAFIVRPESLFSKRPYAKSQFVEGQIASFFEGLSSYNSLYHDITIHLNGKLPNDVIPYLNNAFANILPQSNDFTKKNGR